jgi:tRNA/rRNA methyltransferase
VRNRQLHHPLKLLADGARLMRKRLASGGVALLFGSEKRGLSNQDLSYCHWLLHIPAQEAHISMNLGQAVAVCLYELARDGKLGTQAERVQSATAGEMERITTLLLDALQASGYLKAGPAALTEEKLRRLVRRLNLAESDAELWLGMLRQILWKLKRASAG